MSYHMLLGCKMVKISVFWNKCRTDCYITLVHGVPDVVRPLPHRLYRFVDGERQPVPAHEVPVTCARHYVERAVDCQRHHGQPQLVGKHERPPAEVAHASRERARPLGEHHHARAVPKYVAGMVVGLLYFARASLVNENLVALYAGIAYEWYLLQSLFHHPLEVAAQVSEDEEYVERPLMV